MFQRSTSFRDSFDRSTQAQTLLESLRRFPHCPLVETSTFTKHFAIHGIIRSGPFVLTRPMIDLASTNRGEFVHDMRNHHHYLVHYLVHRLVESKGRFINMIIIRCVYDAPFRRSSFSLPPSSFSSRLAARLHGETPS